MVGAGPHHEPVLLSNLMEELKQINRRLLVEFRMSG